MSRMQGVIICLVLTLIGAGLSGSLYHIHATGKSGGILGKVCGGEGRGCDKVLSSRWATLPPGPVAVTDAGSSGAEVDGPGGPAAPEHRAVGVPVAALGLFYFSALGVWFAAVGRPTGSRRWMHTAVLCICVAGVLGSIWFIIVMGALIRSWCPLCLGTHVVNLLLLGAVILARPRATGADEAVPSLRLAVVTIALAASVVFGEWKAFSAAGLSRGNEQLMQALEDLTGTVRQVELAYFQQEKADLDIRPDDPAIEAASGTRMTVVMFSDIECRFCAAYDGFLRNQVLPMFNDHLRLVFKHLPNTREHPNAYRAATAVEAARIQGQFWPMYDLLLQRRDALDGLSYEAAAEELGLNVEQFTRDMASEAVQRRIQEDMQQARRLGANSTPTVFLNLRPLDQLTRELPGFWELRRDGLKRVREARGQDW
jgi:protein-disulfide isomerase